MKKILIHTDEKLFTAIQSDLKRFIPKLEKLKITYEALEMGTFTSEVMAKLKNQGANLIETEFYSNIKSQLDKAGITLKIIRLNLINQSQVTLTEFQNAFEEARNLEHPQYLIDQRPVLNFNQISYNEKSKEFEIDSEAKENILETKCKVYLTNEIEKNIYDSLQNFIKAQKEVRKNLSIAGYSFENKGYEINEIAEVFLNTLPNVSVNPKSIKYATGQREQKELISRMMDKINNRNQHHSN